MAVQFNRDTFCMLRDDYISDEKSSISVIMFIVMKYQQQAA